MTPYLVILNESEVSTQNTENGLLNAEFGVDFLLWLAPCNPLGRYAQNDKVRLFVFVDRFV